MIVPSTTTDDKKEPDLSGLNQQQRDNIQSVRYLSGTDEYEITLTEKYERNLLKEENKRLKAEIKLFRDRIADAVDFPDLKSKLTAIKDSEGTPTKWVDKSKYYQGQYVEHKGIIFLVLIDHASDKAKEPPVTPEWYERMR
jgi:hypothetical protein